MTTHSIIFALRVPWTEEIGVTVHRVPKSKALRTTEGALSQEQGWGSTPLLEVCLPTSFF